MAAPSSSSATKFSPLFLALFSLLITISRSTQLQSNDDQQEGFISVLVSDKGLEFAKDLLISEALSSIVPLQLPRIRKSVKIPVVGQVDFVLSNITIDSVEIASSYVKTGEEGIALIASGATANLSLNWEYSYSSWWISASDGGTASVKVKGMEVGLTMTLTDQGGTLKLSLLDCGCYVKAISIKLDVGSSWLYQLLVDAFESQIVSAVEEAIPKKIGEGITSLDSKLQELPREMPVGEAAALNVTFVRNPVLGDSSIGLEIDGLFRASDDLNNIVVSEFPPRLSLSLPSCSQAEEMVQISLHENVLKSASSVYFNAGYMNLIVDNLPDQKLLNTAGWKYIIPQLYKQYPNDGMQLGVSASSPPTIKVSDQGINALIYSDLVIDVINSGEIVPVACISLEISASGSAQILRNNLAGTIKLDEFSASLKWSKIGNLHIHLVQPVISAVIRTVVVPYINLQLMRGFPLPLIRGVTLRNARILYDESRTLICSDVDHTTADLTSC